MGAQRRRALTRPFFVWQFLARAVGWFLATGGGTVLFTASRGIALFPTNARIDYYPAPIEKERELQKMFDSFKPLKMV
jgi:hypothetical protein